MPEFCVGRTSCLTSFHKGMQHDTIFMYMRHSWALNYSIYSEYKRIQMRSLYRNGTAILTLVLVSSSSLSQSLCVCVCVSVEREIVINFARCNIPECIHFDWYWFISENWIVLIVKIVVVVVVFFGRSDCLCSCCYCCCSNVFCTLEQYLVDTISDFHSTELRTKKSHTRSVR